MLFESREPDPLERIQLQLAGIAATFASGLSGKKKIKAEEFLVRPQWEERQTVKRTPEQVEAQWLAWAAWQNRKGKRRG